MAEAAVKAVEKQREQMERKKMEKQSAGIELSRCDNTDTPK